MAVIKIEPLEDYGDCETCGGGSDYGGRVWIDDNLIYESIPIGCCYGGEYVSETDLIRKALEHLGHTLEVI